MTAESSSTRPGVSHCGTIEPSSAVGAERPFYVEREGEQLYHVFHAAHSPRAAALLVGPFPTERAYAYTPWVRWARYLAACGIAALRFDYRGAGESTGSFPQGSIAAWVDDARHSLDWLTATAPGLPVVIHGLGFGCLVTNALRTERADAFILWSPPASAEDAMKEILMRRFSADFKNSADGKRKTWDDYIRELEGDGYIDVQGYSISGRLWREAKVFAAATTRLDDQRPTRSVKLDRRAAPLIAGIGQWRSMDPNLQTGRVPLEADLTYLFKETVDWLSSALAFRKESEK